MYSIGAHKQFQFLISSLTEVFRILLGSSRTCKDFDECATNNGKGDCEYACANTKGSFLCSCPAGFSLDEDELTCVDVDECQVKNGKCSQLCLNKPGTHVCDCFDGYVNSGDNGTDVICLDIGRTLRIYETEIESIAKGRTDRSHLSPWTI